MKKSIHRYYSFISLALAAFIVNVYITEAWCNMHPHHEISEQADHHDADHHDSKENDHEGKCCKDDSSLFFSKLNSPPSLTSLANPVGDHHFLLSQIISFTGSENILHTFVSESPPGDSGSSLYLLHQIFRI